MTLPGAGWGSLHPSQLMAQSESLTSGMLLTKNLVLCHPPLLPLAKATHWEALSLAMPVAWTGLCCLSCFVYS